MRSEARQRQILECAKKVFAERGFHAANISHICAEAGIGRGTLYQYFPNKKSVFTALLRETAERVRTFMEQRRQDVRLPRPERMRREAVIAWTADRLRELIQVAFADERMLRIILREAVGLDMDVERILSDIDDALIAIVEQDLQLAIERGIVRELDPRVAATLIVGGVEKLLVAALRGDAPIDMARLAREIARMHLTGTLSENVPS
ncbi:MAG TPA: TetR/AcrR family transcriptional regulator [Kofleriaceae bacterium]|nr:TetR/AcrR family transcriptional regulator [Kofleriaceae bacterium]